MDYGDPQPWVVLNLFHRVFIASWGFVQTLFHVPQIK